MSDPLMNFITVYEMILRIEVEVFSFPLTFSTVSIVTL